MDFVPSFLPFSQYYSKFGSSNHLSEHLFNNSSQQADMPLATTSWLGKHSPVPVVVKSMVSISIGVTVVVEVAWTLVVDV